MYLWNLSLMSFREWRVTHAFSHHIYPNTLHDIELAGLEFVFKYIPSQKLKPTKGLIRYLPWVLPPVIYGLYYFMDFLGRVIFACQTRMRVFYWDNVVIPLLIPSVMLLLGDQSLFVVFKLWMVMLWAGSFLLVSTVINVTHFHTEIVLEGDALQ